MAESGAKVSTAAVPEDQVSPPGFVPALAQSSRRIWEALQALLHWEALQTLPHLQALPCTDRFIPSPTGAVLQDKGILSI